MSIDKKSTYYDAGGIETINIIRAKLTSEQFQGFLLGNIIKYACRLNFKNNDLGQRDSEKVLNYSTQLEDYYHTEASLNSKLSCQSTKNKNEIDKVLILSMKGVLDMDPEFTDNTEKVKAIYKLIIEQYPLGI